MKKKLLVGFVALLVCVALPAYGSGLSFIAYLSSAQIPPNGMGEFVDAPGSGTFRIEFADDFSYAKYDLNLFDVVNLVQHIHCAGAGQVGPIVVSLGTGGVITNATIAANVPGAGNPCTATVNNVASLYDALLAGLLYVNVHTPDNLPGEIRAQIFEDAQEDN